MNEHTSIEQCSAHLAYPGEKAAVSQEQKVTSSIAARTHVELIAKLLVTDVCAVKIKLKKKVLIKPMMHLSDSNSYDNHFPNYNRLHVLLHVYRIAGDIGGN